MIKVKDRAKLQENLLYTIIWALVILIPIEMELWGKFTEGTVFKWDRILRWWGGMIPIILIFAVNNHFLLPKLMKKGKIGYYVLSLVAVVLIYGTASHIIEGENMPGPGDRLHGPPPHMVNPHHGHDEYFHKAPHEEEFNPYKMGKPPYHLPFRMLFKIILVITTLGTNIAISLIFTYFKEEEKRKELENFRLQEELKYLKQQVSPHFFMNVLNNIHEMAEDDTKTAQNMILELSHMMRYVLYDSENSETTLGAESRFISSYVALMKRRYFEDMVRINLVLPREESANIRIPPLLFISFIENAFKHGVSYLKETLIDIRLSEADGKIFFKCENTVPDKKSETQEKGGVGLTNIRRRLDLLYGQDYTLNIIQDKDIYTVTLILPC